MVFSSIEFLWFFMPAVLGLYMLVPPKARNAVLAAASLVFYAWGAHAIVFLFAASVGVNHLAGRAIGRLRENGREGLARRVMWGAIVLDLAVLFTWKYAVFAIQQLDHILGIFGRSDAIVAPSITLPIGISFFTFHAISYVVDVSRLECKPMRRIWDFAQYMAFFPQLIAGPIIRYHEINGQVLSPPPRSRRFEDLAEGFPRFALGLSKKVLIADQVSQVANAAFADTHALTSAGAWLGALAFTVQIYFDFSGYTDMAIGLARMFGFRFPENFDRPYSSISMTDFWRRWHMSLSRWFRDYLYIPLGGSRGSRAATYRNLVIVFVLVGFWHGAAWTFVLWGLYHGALLIAERITGIRTWSSDRVVIPRRALTFLLVVLGWVLFRAATVGDAGRVYGAMFGFVGGPLAPPIHGALTAEPTIALCVGLASVLLPRRFVLGRVVQDRWSGAPLVARVAVLCVLPLAAITVAAGSFSPFLYFRF